MIRHSLLTSQLRFFNEETPDPFAPYDAICTISWETPAIVWLIGLHGTLTRGLFREMLKYFYDAKVKTIKAYRAPGHRLPFATSIGENLYSIDVEKVYEAMQKK